MRFIALFLTLLLAVSMGAADAATKKKSAAPPVPKELWNSPMRVVIVRDGGASCEPDCPEWISAEGEITGGTPAQFRKVFKQMGKKKLPIVLQSPGGSINAAIEIGKMIRDRKLDVLVGFTRYDGCTPIDKTCRLPKEFKGIYRGSVDDSRAFCNSACPMILAGGVNRSVGYYASVGVHEPRTTWTRDYVRYREFYKIVRGKKKITERKIISRKTKFVKETYGVDKRLRKNLTAHYKALGIDVGIVDDMSKASHKEMHWLPGARMNQLRIRTSTTSAVSVINSNLCHKSTRPDYCIVDKSFDPVITEKRRQEHLGITPDMPAMTFRLARLGDPSCGANCPTWIVAEGVITESTPQMFRAFALQFSVLNAPVIFNSPGGDARGAMNLGRAIREAKLHTGVGETLFEGTSDVTNAKSAGAAKLTSSALCNGTCLVAFAGGIERHANKTQRATVFRPDAYDNRPAVIVDLNQYLRGMGVSQNLMTELHTLRADEKRNLSRADLLQFAVASDAQDIHDLLAAGKCLANLAETGCVTPQEHEVETILRGETPKATPMLPLAVISKSASCKPKCPIWIYAEGEITTETEMAFKALLDAYDKQKLRVILNAIEGRADVAMRIGQLLRQRKATVAIAGANVDSCVGAGACKRADLKLASINNHGSCMGACVLMMIGGSTRLATPHAAIAFSKSKKSGVDELGAATNQSVIDYLVLQGAGPQLLELAKDAFSGRIQPVSNSKGRELGLLNSDQTPMSLTTAQNCAFSSRWSNCVSTL